MDNKKIIDRIRKLLTMSKDSSSPNEAAIAAGRAAKLMQQYNLETAEVILSNITEDTITENSTNTKYSTFPSWASYLAIPVAHLNDCECRLNR